MVPTAVPGLVRCASSRSLRSRLPLCRLHSLGQAKIQNLRVSPLGHKDVRRLDVAVDDAGSVSNIESICHLNAQRQQHFRFQRTPSYAMLEGRTVQKLHCDECLTILLANVINRANVGVV
jgi:hypothetical protein